MLCPKVFWFISSLPYFDSSLSIFTLPYGHSASSDCCGSCRRGRRFRRTYSVSLLFVLQKDYSASFSKDTHHGEQAVSLSLFLFNFAHFFTFTPCYTLEKMSRSHLHSIFLYRLTCQNVTEHTVLPNIKLGFCQQGLSTRRREDEQTSNKKVRKDIQSCIPAQHI